MTDKPEVQESRSPAKATLSIPLCWLIFLVLFAVPCAANASLPPLHFDQSITFEQGSAILAPSARKNVADLVKRAMVHLQQNTQVTVGTEASRNDDIGLRSARINAVIRQLQAEGVSSTRIKIKLEDYDAIRAGWLETIAKFRAVGTYISPVDLTQRTGITIRITLGDQP